MFCDPYAPANHAANFDNHDETNAWIPHSISMGLRPAALRAAGAPRKCVANGFNFVESTAFLKAALFKFVSS